MADNPAPPFIIYVPRNIKSKLEQNLIEIQRSGNPLELCPIRINFNEFLFELDSRTNNLLIKPNPGNNTMTASSTQAIIPPDMITITTLGELHKHSFTNCTIDKYSVNGIVNTGPDSTNTNKEPGTENKSFAKLLELCYSKIGDKTLIKPNTYLNIVNEERRDKGFRYMEKWGFSYQGADSNKMVRAIYNQAELNNLGLDLYVTLESGAKCHITRELISANPAIEPSIINPVTPESSNINPANLAEPAIPLEIVYPVIPDLVTRTEQLDLESPGMIKYSDALESMQNKLQVLVNKVIEKGFVHKPGAREQLSNVMYVMKRICRNNNVIVTETDVINIISKFAIFNSAIFTNKKSLPIASSLDSKEKLQSIKSQLVGMLEIKQVIWLMNYEYIWKGAKLVSCECCNVQLDYDQYLLHIDECLAKHQELITKYITLDKHTYVNTVPELLLLDNTALQKTLILSRHTHPDPVCQDTIELPENTTAHTDTIDNPNKTIYICTKCNKPYATLKGYTTCMLKCDLKLKTSQLPDSSVTCEFCNITYNYKPGQNDQLENIKRHIDACKRKYYIKLKKAEAKVAKQVAKVNLMIQSLPKETIDQLNTNAINAVTKIEAKSQIKKPE